MDSTICIYIFLRLYMYPPIAVLLQQRNCLKVNLDPVESGSRSSSVNIPHTGLLSYLALFSHSLHFKPKLVCVCATWLIITLKKCFHQHAYMDSANRNSASYKTKHVTYTANCFLSAHSNLIFCGENVWIPDTIFDAPHVQVDEFDICAKSETSPWKEEEEEEENPGRGDHFSTSCCWHVSPVICRECTKKKEKLWGAKRKRCRPGLQIKNIKLKRGWGFCPC